MTQKTNKIIFLIAILLAILIILLAILKKPTEEINLISICEHLLNIPNREGKLPPQRVCKVVTTNNEEKAVEELEPDVPANPEDELIIVVNLPKILQRKMYNIFTGEVLEKPQDNVYTLCFVIYPMLTELDMYEPSEDNYNNFYQNYDWQIIPDSILNPLTKGDNYICTKPLELNQFPVVSLRYQIPSKEFLSLAKTNTRSFGLKIISAPENLKNSLAKAADISLNASQFSPIFYYRKPISFK